MRDILFRGKSIFDGDWLYGWYSTMTAGKWPFRDCIIPRKDALNGYRHEEEVLSATVSQFTGLRDKNGKPIFEGDILRWDEREYGSPHAEVVKWDFDLLAMRKDDWHEWCEVIGNIFDNPELAEEG